MVLPPIDIKDIAPEIKKLVKPVAIATRGDNSSGVFIILKLRDRDGKVKTKKISVTDAVNLTSLKTFLVENNIAPSTEPTYYKKLQTLILQNVDVRVNLVRTPGRNGNKYVLPDSSVIGSKNGKKYMLDSSEDIETLEMGKKGSLNDWKNNVACYSIHSSRLMLGICSGFSGYLISLTNIDGGGFHLNGLSADGKTTTLYIVASIQGPRENMGSWDITKASVEAFAAARNDMVILLDEFKLLGDNKTKAAEKASGIIYMLAQGKGKKRSKKYENYTFTWNVIILSAGEVSLTDNAKGGGVKRLLGEQVRLIDVQSDAGKNMGIYESLPKEFTTSSALAEHLNEATLLYYGTAQSAFLKPLTNDLAKDRKQVKKNITKHITFFMKKHNVDPKLGYNTRFAKRFAFAYASGAMAVDYGVLPFTKQDVMDGISKCYLDAFKASRSIEDNVADACALVRKELKSAPFLNISNKGHGYTCDEVKSAPVFKSIIKFRKPQMVKIISSERMIELIPDDEILKGVLKQFYIKGQLLRDSDGKSTRQPKSKITGCNLPRAYFFKPRKKKS